MEVKDKGEMFDLSILSKLSAEERKKIIQVIKRDETLTKKRAIITE
jgi:hypothetical protein